MDVIGTPERAPRDLPSWLQRRVVLPVLACVAVLAGAVAYAVPLLRGPDPAALSVVLVGVGSGTDGDSADGELTLRLENAQDRPLTVGALSVKGRGLQSPGSDPIGELGAFEQREVLLRFEVPDCQALELPARVRLTSVGDAGPREQLLRAAIDPDRFDPCARRADLAPPALGPPDLAIRGTGGTTTAAGSGARGALELQVRNGGRTVRLARLTAEVGGVSFQPRTPPNGATLRQDELIGLSLGFVIEDCAELVRAGRIVFTVLEPDGPLEIAVPLLDDRGVRQQGALDRVLDACPQ